jgi:hypothetical protein
MICSHGVQFELKCRGCFDDAMKFLEKQSKQNAAKPVPKPTPEQRDAFWLSAYNQPAPTPKGFNSL